MTLGVTTLQPLSPEQFSTRPGVYLMKDGDGAILYVGKAKNLRARLRSYLRADADGRPQIRFLLAKVASVETIVTDTEKEALILENTLIKAHHPRYNLDLRDDKTYVSIRLDPRDPFPALQMARRVSKDGALYFGPFSSGAAVRETLKQIYRIFPLRHHATEVCARRRRPCLFYQIGQCSGPCHGKISSADYAELVRGAVAFLSGREDDVLRQLREQMRAAAAGMRFEEAALLRDRIAAIEKTLERQKVMTHGGGDSDVFGLYGDGHEYEIVVLLLRKGRLLDRRNYRVQKVLEVEEQELLASAVQRFYGENDFIPEQILTAKPLVDAELLAEWLADRRGGKVALFSPQRGEKLGLIELACRNAADLFGVRHATVDGEAVISEIAEQLGLRQLPRRMECFDISNLSGQSIVGSMVVFTDAKPDKDQYRRYEVTTVSGAPDDYAAMREVLLRRLERGIAEGNLPQLIVVDGGKGQLGILEELVAELGLTESIDLASIAKARAGAAAGGSALRSEERFFRPGSGEPILLPRGSVALLALERLRDEAHRFALRYHRQKRAKNLLASQLEAIPGIGPKRRLALLRHFGSLRKVREATLAELAAAPKIGVAAAEKVYAQLHPRAAEDSTLGERLSRSS